MNNLTKKVIPLHFWTCFFLDSKDGNYPTIKPNLTLNCRSQGKFLFGTEDDSSSGHAFCIFICVLIYIVGLLGFFSNILNALVLQKTLKGSSVSLRFLLITLAVFELLACLFSISFATVIILILENVDRSKTTIYMLRYCHILYSNGRTAAIYMTILVTIERYLVVAFPIKSKSWLTPTKSRIYVLGVLILTFLLDLPWIFNSTVMKNSFAKLSPNTSLANFPYIMSGTSFSRYVYPKIRIYQLLLNYVAPFPLLLIFNGLLCFSIYSWNKNRQALSSRQKKEINAAKMFSVVVLILLSCHTAACFLVFFAQHVKVVHRELMMVQLLSVTLSAAANFLVYMSFGKPFRVELRRIVLKGFGQLTGKYLFSSGVEDSRGMQSSETGETPTSSVDDKKKNKLEMKQNNTT